jgi:hypothetical protein
MIRSVSFATCEKAVINSTRSGREMPSAAISVRISKSDFLSSWHQTGLLVCAVLPFPVCSECEIWIPAQLTCFYDAFSQSMSTFMIMGKGQGLRSHSSLARTQSSWCLMRRSKALHIWKSIIEMGYSAAWRSLSKMKLSGVKSPHAAFAVALRGAQTLETGRNRLSREGGLCENDQFWVKT